MKIENYCGDKLGDEKLGKFDESCLSFLLFIVFTISPSINQSDGWLVAEYED